MANTFSNTQLVTFKSLRGFRNRFKFVKNIDQSYSSQFGVAGAKVGSQISVRKKQRFAVSSGSAAQIQGLTDATTPITMTIRSHVAYQIDSTERYLSADDLMNRYGNEAVVAMSNAVENNALAFGCVVSPNWAGTLGTAPTDNSGILDLGVTLDNYSAPDDLDRNLIVTPNQMKKAIMNDQQLFNHQGELGKQFKKGVVGEAHGFDWFKSQNVPIFTSGVRAAATPLINGASQTGTTINIKGMGAAGIIKMGEKLRITGVNNVNMQSRQDNGSPFSATVMANATADGSGLITGLQIYPGITPTGTLQNVTGSPADNAPITLWAPTATVGATGLAWTKEAFAIVFGKLGLPKGDMVEGFSEQDPETGAWMRYVMFWDGINDVWIIRWDILYGYAALIPEWSSVYATAA